TAAALASVTGAAMVIDPALREINMGGWEGLTHPEARARYPDEYDAWSAGRPVRRGGGEIEAEAGARAAAFITTQLARPDHLETRTVAVVAHGTVLRAALDRLATDGAIDLDGPAPSFANVEWRCFIWRGA
ncbi:MAG: histidine phosphatase family protein, partial [Acidimicrobiaceae bacterium]|nr:histidine phosphatase family protein [Acidimicrobiaceae bacterium]